MPISEHFADMVASRVGEARALISSARDRGGHGQQVTLVAVTKTLGMEAIRAAYDAGVHDLGENKVQEAEGKMEAVDFPVRWHLIGHLQRNKAKSAVGFSLIHSMDSERLALALNDVATKAGKIFEVLLQVNASGETSKGGVAPGEVSRLADRLMSLEGLKVMGAMTIAPFDAAEPVLRQVFSETRRAGELLMNAGLPARLLSMGMSGDFEIAVEEGATHVRLGTVLFGRRL